MHEKLRKQAVICDTIKSHFNDISLGITKWKHDQNNNKSSGAVGNDDQKNRSN